MATKFAFPGSEYFDRAAHFYTNQVTYWTDVAAQLNRTAERVRGREEYGLKEWLNDAMDLWERSLTAGEAILYAPLSLSDDDRTPVVTFELEQGVAADVPPKTVRIDPVNKQLRFEDPIRLGPEEQAHVPDKPGADEEEETQDEARPELRPMARENLAPEMVRRGLLKVALQNMKYVAPGRYVTVIGNSDGPLAIVHIRVNPNF
jgi:hypothetical protein